MTCVTYDESTFDPSAGGGDMGDMGDTGDMGDMSGVDDGMDVLPEGGTDGAVDVMPEDGGAAALPPWMTAQLRRVSSLSDAQIFARTIHGQNVTAYWKT